jgi:2,4-diketo-3-deoxy-L-fuconate hydrolase
MKLLTFHHATGPRPGLALSPAIGLDLLAVAPDLPPRWNELFAHRDRIAQVAAPWLERLNAHEAERAAGAGAEGPDPVGSPLFSLDGVLLLPPVMQPTKIIAVGRNYRKHAEEQNRPVPEAPLLFAKAPSCLQGAYGPIVLSPDLDRVDAEAELAVVICQAGRAITRAQARDHIAGYTCFNDVSDRAAQFGDKQWFRGKSIDTGGPCGPWIVTPDELPDLASGLRITARWNGRLMQSSCTDQLIFPVDELISYASRHMTLLPGDIIATGTPSGVGVFREPPVFLAPGDLVEVEIERIGKLANPVIRG